MSFNHSCVLGVAEHFSGDGVADSADPPLCHDLESFINGAGHGELSANFQTWLEGMARVRIQDLACLCAAVQFHSAVALPAASLHH